MNVKFDDWASLGSVFVEVRFRGQVVRKGVVDAVTEDSAVLWLAAYGTDSRELFEASAGYEVWIHPRELEELEEFRKSYASLLLGTPAA
jgi:hypothetical protein